MITPGRGYRLVLARLRRNSHAEHLLIEEIGDDAFSWTLVSLELADMICAEARAQIRERPGLTEDHVIDHITRCIARELDGEDAA